MESWEKDFRWLETKHKIAQSLGKEELPDFYTILFLIGVQELGALPEDKFTKEQKQDLMHIAICALLEPEGYFEFVGQDQDGWPHWNQVKNFTITGINEQEEFLKEKVIHYFDHVFAN
jgi:hypothetical protein